MSFDNNPSNVHPHDFRAYRKAFEDALGTSLFKKVQDFFDYLFVEEDSDRPIAKRCYIVITRKGFSLWVIGMLCGMIGHEFDSKRLISDRQWKLMTIDERNVFINGKHVFVADDSVITGAMSQSVYLDVDVSENRALSRSVAFLIADENYNFESMFQYYYRVEEVNVERRQEYNSKILFAMYQAAIPFTASSPAFYTQIPQCDFKELIEKCKKSDERSWRYKDTELNFGNHKSFNNVGVFMAPTNATFGENVLLRGIRVCHSNFNADGMVDVTFIPLIIFDAIDFFESKAYLKKCATDYILKEKGKSWLYDQLEQGEPLRVKTIIHRIISYLYDCCILKEFQGFLKNVELYQYTLPNSIKLGQYHFPIELYEELEILEKRVCEDDNYPTQHLAMGENFHKELSNAIFEMSYSGLELPNYDEDIDDLEIKLFKQREVTRNKEGNPVFPSNTKKHPLICFKGNCGLKVLELVRRAIGSLRSEIISYKDKTYLINTLFPGEGSHLVSQRNYDFIYAYHYWIESKKFSSGTERAFVDKWNTSIANRIHDAKTEYYYQFSLLSPRMADALFGTEIENSIYDWPSESAILKSKGINPHCITGEEEYYLYFKEIEKIVDAI